MNHMTRVRRAELVLAIGAAAGLALLIAVGIYLAGWWLRADSKDRQVRIDNHNVGVQNAWRDEALDHLTEIEVLQNSPQSTAAVAALKDRTCDLIAKLTDTYRNDGRLVAFWETECV